MPKQRINSVMHTPEQNKYALLQNNSTLNSKKCGTEQINSALNSIYSALIQEKHQNNARNYATEPINSTLNLLMRSISSKKCGLFSASINPKNQQSIINPLIF
jgi:hypothetical protein